MQNGLSSVPMIKKRARINCILHFLYHLEYPNKDKNIAHAPDPKIVGHVNQIYGEKKKFSDGQQKGKNYESR